MGVHGRPQTGDIQDYRCHQQQTRDQRLTVFAMMAQLRRGTAHEQRAQHQLEEPP